MVSMLSLQNEEEDEHLCPVSCQPVPLLTNDVRGCIDKSLAVHTGAWDTEDTGSGAASVGFFWYLFSSRVVDCLTFE